MLWEQDPLLPALRATVPDDLVAVPFNPTAENMAVYLTEVVGPMQLAGTGVTLIGCRVDETRKCSASYTL